MNIFFLHENPFMCAEYHCDKHVIKMISETAQMLSTAHRVLDGTLKFEIKKTKKGKKRKIKRWVLHDRRENILHLASHPNHPCNLWVRETYGNYQWTRMLLGGLMAEYDLRYSDNNPRKKFEKARQIYVLSAPTNIPDDSLENSMNIDYMTNTTVPALAMPEIYQEKEIKNIDSIVRSYRRFYLYEKMKFANWKFPRQPPDWIPFEIV